MRNCAMNEMEQGRKMEMKRALLAATCDSKLIGTAAEQNCL